MLFYSNHNQTILDEYDRILIPYEIGSLIRYSNDSGHPDYIIQAGDSVTLCKNTIKITFPVCTHHISFPDEDTVNIDFVTLTTQRLNPFSHYRHKSKGDVSTRKPVVIDRRMLPLGKFRITGFKGYHPQDE